MQEEYGGSQVRDTGNRRLAIPPFVGAGVGLVLGLIKGAAEDTGGMLSELSYFIFGGLGAIIGLFSGLLLGIFLWFTRPR